MAIQQILSGERTDIEVHGIGQKVQLSWICFMDVITRNWKTHIPYDKLLEEAKKLQLPDERD